MRIIYFLFVLTICTLTLSCTKDQAPPFEENLSENSVEARTCVECVRIQSFEVKEIVSEDDCCTYEVRVEFDFDCGPFVVELDGEFLFNATVSNPTHEFTVCDDQPHEVSIYALSNDPCETIVVNCKCDCKGVVYFLNDLGFNENGCCVYEVEAAGGNTECPAILNIGNDAYGLSSSAITVNVEVCADQTIPVNVTKGGIVCKEDELSCICCVDVKATVETLGDTNGNTCCEFLVNVDNFSSCTQFIYGPSGNIIATIPSGEIYNEVIEQCPQGPLAYTYTVGPDPNLECESFILTAVCPEPCCEDVTSTVTNLGDLDDNGCCDMQLNIVNGDDCTKTVVDGKGLTRTTIPPGATYTHVFNSCLDEPWVGQWKLYDPAGNLCEEYDLSEECENCCDNVNLVYTVAPPEMPDCCTYVIVASNNSDCPMFFFDETDFSAPINPGETRQFTFTVCPKKGNTIYHIGPVANQPSQACKSLYLEC